MDGRVLIQAIALTGGFGFSERSGSSGFDRSESLGSSICVTSYLVGLLGEVGLLGSCTFVPSCRAAVSP